MTTNDKMMRLRKLHGTPDQNAHIASLVLEIAGILLLALGLVLVMTGTAMQSETTISATIILCLLGWSFMALGYPTYGWVVAWQRRRIAPEILQLTEELLM